MPPPTDDVKNWMHLFRWIVKLIRDEYDVPENTLTRTATLESDCGLVIEQVEEVLALVSQAFAIRFPPSTLDEVLRLEELCMLAAWLKGLYKKPPFISDNFDQICRGLNPGHG